MKLSWSLMLKVGVVVVPLLWHVYGASTLSKGMSPEVLEAGRKVVSFLGWAYSTYTLFKDWGLGPVVLEYGAVVVPLLWYVYRLHVLISR
jgi:hypothetical protein